MRCHCKFCMQVQVWVRVYMGVCVCVCVCVCVSKQSHYPQRHNKLVSHISSGKSLDNYTGLSLFLRLLLPFLFFFSVSYIFLLLLFSFLHHFFIITRHTYTCPSTLGLFLSFFLPSQPKHTSTPSPQLRPAYKVKLRCCGRINYGPILYVWECAGWILSSQNRYWSVTEVWQTFNLQNSSIRGGILQPFFTLLLLIISHFDCASVTVCTQSSFKSRGIHSHLFPYCCYLKAKVLTLFTCWRPIPSFNTTVLLWHGAVITQGIESVLIPKENLWCS